MKKLNADEIVKELNITKTTLNRWYKWYNMTENKPTNCPELPKYEQQYSTAPRFWNEDSIEALRKFKNWVPKGSKGLMGEVSQVYWAKRKRSKKYKI
jgi:hypothetical protein